MRDADPGPLRPTLKTNVAGLGQSNPIFLLCLETEGGRSSCGSLLPCRPHTMKELLNQMVAHRGGVLALLAVAAFLEVYGDSCFQSVLYRSSGVTRVLALATGALSLVAYGLVVNTPRWDFGRLLGVYVVLFFLLAQIMARVRFGQSPTLSTAMGGVLIIAGGVIVSLGGH